MTKADQVLERWNNDPNPIDDVVEFVRRDDPKCRVNTYLYTHRKDFIFSDGSKLTFAQNCLYHTGVR